MIHSIWNLKFLICFVFALISFHFAANDVPAAQSSSVTAVQVKGVVQVISADDGSRPLRPGMKLTDGEVVESGPGSEAVLELEDGSRMTVFEESRVEISDFVIEQKDKSSFSLFLGRISLKLKKLRSRNLIVTSTMICGVRGTEFSVSVTEDGASVVSVERGEVTLSADKDDEETKEVSVTSGQEVLLNEAGGTITPRPMQIRTDSDWRAFRQQRLEKIVSHLPQITGHLEQRLENEMFKLERIKVMIQDKAGNIERLARQIKALEQGEQSKRQNLLLQLRKESAGIFKLGRRFRTESVRVHQVFVRSARFSKILPRFKAELGDDYQEVQQNLTRILERREEFKTRVRGLSQEARQAVAPIRPILARVQQMQQKRGPSPGSSLNGRR